VAADLRAGDAAGGYGGRLSAMSDGRCCRDRGAPARAAAGNDASLAVDMWAVNGSIERWYVPIAGSGVAGMSAVQGGEPCNRLYTEEEDLAMKITVSSCAFSHATDIPVEKVTRSNWTGSRTNAFQIH